MISEGQRLQYLEAMGIQAWISREQVKSPDQLASATPANVPVSTALRQERRISGHPASFEIGPGSGSILLLCTRPEDSATPFASDIARCLDEAPVWGWLARDHDAPEAAESGLSLEQAIVDRLFTRVLLFCGDSDAGLVGKVEIVGSARVIHAPPIAELANHPAHKRRLWTQLLTHGWCPRQG